MKKRITTAMLMLMCAAVVSGQVKMTPDTLECHVIGFSVGALAPGYGSASEQVQHGNMRDLYDAPWLDFALSCDYKYANNWLVTLDGDLWFGMTSDNLLQRSERMGDIFSSQGQVMSWGGYDGAVQAYNRGLAARLGLGKILRVLPNSPNSGVLLKASAGWMMQKTLFSQNYHESPVPQLEGDYAKLYDHKRNGFILSQGIGFVYMSNYQTFINVRVVLEISEVWSRSAHAYQLDNLMNLNGPDNNRYFDLLYSLKLSWMFPLTGRTNYDYYYY